MTDRLGDILLKEGLINPEQLNMMINHQQKFGGRLGDIATRMNLVHPHALNEALTLLPPKERLGTLLLNSGYITQDELDAAVKYQEKYGGMLGDIMLTLQLIDSEMLYRAIASQFQLGRTGKEVLPELSKRLPEYIARQYDAIVLTKDLNRYLVAVTRPLQSHELLVIESFLDLPAEQVLASNAEMDVYWKLVYRDELLKESSEKLFAEQPENSARVTFTKPQIYTCFAVLGVTLIGLLWNWLQTIIVINAIVQIFYFCMCTFKFSILYMGMQKNAQIRINKQQLDAIDERTFPIYTILVPMYRETEVVRHLVRNIEQMDYPKAKLDVRLLIEEDDLELLEVIQSMQLPAYYTTIIVPHSLPKTKPKACNYGLIRARGEYVVIYDAEDKPDKDQLKKVIAAYQSLPEQYVCIQAKLNYFNSGQNLLTRWFTHEYSMWFELLLPGVMQLDIPVPLGGTSNHFKTEVLRQLNAWDPYNVTEDADLGIRLYKSGFKTAIIDSFTWEEANSHVGNWIRQRSRWIKGYLQTWLVHMRNPYKLWRELGTKGFLGFQVMVLGTPVVPMLNPFFWTLLILWYTTQWGFIDLFFPGAIYYMAETLLILGNFLFVYSHTAGMHWIITEMRMKGEDRFSYSLIKYSLIIPLYWVLMSIASVKAGWQLITKPFYWEKTRHGLSNLEEAAPLRQSVDGGA